MRCEDFDELIYLFWDGELEQSKKEELEKHLLTCNRCKEKLAFLGSIEKGAKEIKIKERSQEYWDTFSNRVRERLVARTEKSFSFKLKKVFENIFAFSPLKVKIAAGVVSIVFVFVIGKLYIDYKGKEIIPSKPKMESTKKPTLYAPTLEKEVTPSVHIEEKGKPKEVRIPQEAKVEKEEPPGSLKEKLKSKTVPPSEPEGKWEELSNQVESHKMEVPPEEKVKKEEKPTLPTKELEKTPTSKIVPVEKPTPEEEKAEEKTKLPTTYSAGARGEEKGKVSKDIIQPEQKALNVEGVPLKETTKTVEGKTLSVALERAVETPPASNYYLLEGEKVVQVKEKDTLLQEDTLRSIIERWNRYIEKNPKDSLTNEGYLQVAISYYLLSKLTLDQSVISKGIELLEKYAKQSTDPKIKEELSRKLKELKALKEE